LCGSYYDETAFRRLVEWLD